jgi:radical SAM superfamily enzyme YgiQ (UPF0313 family)
MGMSVLLFNPPTALEGKPTIPPLGLAYLAAVLRENKIRVKIVDFDLEREKLPSLEEIIDREQPAIIGLSALTLQIENAYEMARRIKSRRPEIRVVIGGPHPSSLPESTLAESGGAVDIVVVGEGEYRLLDIARGTDLPDIKGIVFRKNGSWSKTPPSPPISDLDRLPLPARDLLPIARYRGWGPLKKSPSTHLIASRGCPYECIFCSEKSVFGKTHRSRDPARIVDEIEHLVRVYGMREVAFYDDLFTLRKRNVMAICREILDRKLAIQWKTLSRVDTVDAEVLRAMKSAGCWLISYGFESGSQDVLNNIRKRQTIGQCLEAAAWTRQAGIKTFGFFMIGNIGETEATVGETIRFARRLRPDYFQFTIVRPDPGSYLFNQFREQLKQEGVSWNEYYAFPTGRSLMPVVGTTLPLERLFHLRDLAYMHLSRKAAAKGILKAVASGDLQRLITSASVMMKPDTCRL